MITIENLKAYGADVSEGVKRCLDDEEFYIDLVKSVIPDERLRELEEYIAAKDFDKAFEVAHALKGMYGNISLTPIYQPICEITELLRDKKDVDYSVYLKSAKDEKKRLDDLYAARR